MKDCEEGEKGEMCGGGERGEKKSEEAMGEGPMYYSQPPL